MIAVLAACWFAASLAIALSQAADSRHVYYLAVALYPAVLFSSLFEKALVHHFGIERVGSVVGLWSVFIVIGLYFSKNLDEYALVLAVGLSFYPVLLALVLARRFLGLALVAISFSACGLAISASEGPELMLATITGMILIFASFMKARRWMR
jgi:hypothetical protein